MIVVALCTSVIDPHGIPPYIDASSLDRVVRRADGEFILCKNMSNAWQWEASVERLFVMITPKRTVEGAGELCVDTSRNNVYVLVYIFPFVNEDAIKDQRRTSRSVVERSMICANSSSEICNILFIDLIPLASRAWIRFMSTPASTRSWRSIVVLHAGMRWKLREIQYPDEKPQTRNIAHGKILFTLTTLPIVLTQTTTQQRTWRSNTMNKTSGAAQINISRPKHDTHTTSGSAPQRNSSAKHERIQLVELLHTVQSGQIRRIPHKVN
jgi:hypothetical protein